MRKQAVYTTGSIRGIMLKTTLAMLAGTLAMSGYNLADTYFIGRLSGDAPLAAMGFTLPIIMLVGCIFRGLSIGTMTLMAHALGSGSHAKAGRLVTYGFWLMICTSIPIAIGGLLCSKYLLVICGAKGLALELAQDYINIWFLGCVTASMAMSGNDILIAAGDNKVASTMMIIGMILNVIIDPILIFGWLGIPAMGLKGAALATVIAQFCSAIIVWMLLYKRHKLLTIEPWEKRRLRTSWSLMFQYALPASIGMVLMPLGMTVMTYITSKFGDTAVAATATVGRLEMVAFVIPMAMGIALTPTIAQNFGAKQYDRIVECRRFAMRFATFFLLLMAAIFFIIADWVARQFSIDPEVQRLIALGLRIIPWGLAGVEVHRFGGFFYNGCGQPRKAAALNAMRIVIFLIPFSLIALAIGSITVLFLARLLADIVSGVIAFILAKRLTSRLATPTNLNTSGSVTST